MESAENNKKVIVIGDGFCGKTSLVAKITEGKFSNNYHQTIGGKEIGYHSLVSGLEICLQLAIYLTLLLPSHLSPLFPSLPFFPLLPPLPPSLARARPI